VTVQEKRSRLEQAIASLTPELAAALGQHAADGLKKQKQALYDMFFKANHIKYDKLKEMLSHHNNNRMDLSFVIGDVKFRFMFQYRELPKIEEKKEEKVA